MSAQKPTVLAIENRDARICYVHKYGKPARKRNPRSPMEVLPVETTTFAPGLNFVAPTFFEDHKIAMGDQPSWMRVVSLGSIDRFDAQVLASKTGKKTLKRWAELQPEHAPIINAELATRE